MERICRNCRYWDTAMWPGRPVELAHDGECGLVKWYRPPVQPLMLPTGYEAESIETQPEFGCVQWDARMSDDEQEALERNSR